MLPCLMSLDFCGYIRTVGPEFGVNSMQAWIHPHNLQQLRDAIRSIWTKISEEYFQHLVESMPQRVKAALKAKGGPTRY